MSEITLPRFRYVEDVKRFLEKLDSDLRESDQVLTQRQKALTASFSKIDPSITQDLVFPLTPTQRKEQLEIIESMRSKLDVSLSKVVIPNIKRLAAHYEIAEDLYAKLRAVDQCEAQLGLAFQSKRGDQFETVMALASAVRARITSQLRRCFAFLCDIAQKHMPKEFMAYVTLVADTINEHVIFQDSESFQYVSVTNDGELVFTSYLMLRNVANDEGNIAPHLYVSIQWILNSEAHVTVDLNHEYEVPNSLLSSGEMASSPGEAAKIIADMLDLEGFSSALGVVPLALQLKLDPTTLNTNLVSYRDLVSKIVLDGSIRFVLRKEADSPEVVTEVAAQLYKELKSILRHTGIRLTMRQQSGLVFNLVRVEPGDSLSNYDLEVLRSKFGLSSLQLRKFAALINEV